MKNQNKRAYKNYITAAKSKVTEIENGLKDLAKWKRISFMTYEEWVKWQNKEIEI